ncbi:MAG: sulfurtransferase [Blastocatellia bacterium]|nr:sulfurtransferase [Blastocatellia bacterium]MBL8195350.1 sulfurtransferase [Blastocatellia bacterium]MBN8721823.1 sulfurtransferase [Acidobacteriota bacterium]
MKHSVGFLNIVEDSKTRIKEISIEEVKAKLDREEKFYFIDVREDHEWQQGHADRAEHLGRGILERDVENKIPDLLAEVILYCGGGFRSALAADNLQKMGYKNVYSMAGGYRAWQEANYPITK